MKETTTHFRFPRFLSRVVIGEPVVPTLVKWLVAKKIIKNQLTAGIFLFRLSLLNFILSGALIYFFVMR